MSSFNLGDGDLYSQPRNLSFLLQFNWPSPIHLRDAATKLLSNYLGKSFDLTNDLLDEKSFYHTKLLMASNPDTPPDVLRYLTIHSSLPILERIGENPNTSIETLSALARHPEAAVRLAVAENSNTAAKDIELLASDEAADVRYMIAECPHVPTHVLKKLLTDDNTYVSHRARTTFQRLNNQEVLEEVQRENNILSTETAQTNKTQEVQPAVAANLEALRDLQDKLISLAGVNAELQAGRDGALKTARMKSAFITSVSHELRTPLSAILGMNELMLCTTLTNEQRDLAKGIQDAAQSLHTMVDSILDIDKIEAGGMDLENIPFNLVFLVQDSTKLLVEAAKSKNLKLTTHIDQHIPELLYGDSGHMREVLVNLIGNTIRFTKRGQICIEAEIASEDIEAVTVRFSIRNVGEGLSEDEKKMLFMPFIHVGNNAVTTDIGLGLGLTISKQLISMMGGTIELANKNDPDTIATFTLAFKRIKPEMMPVIEQGMETTSTENNKLVLVVEDNDVLRRLAIKQLANLGVHAQAVASGQEALDAVKEIAFDLILMDCHMPGISGFDATKGIRQAEAETGKHIPIVAMTAHAMKGDAERCMAAGMDDYLSKPVNIEQLRQKIERWLIIEKKNNVSINSNLSVK